MGDSIWYDVDRTLSHNCLLNFIVGPRGVGKTYSSKKRAIRNFIKNGEQFIYLRRYSTELTKKVDKFFDDIMQDFPELDFAVKSGNMFINGLPAGYSMALSTAAQYKSVPFPQVSLIIFDEFIIDQGMIRYLPNEVTSFAEMYSTIARMRDVRVLFLSNAITFTNPYFLYFDLKLQPGQTLLKKNDVLLEMVSNQPYIDAAKQTRFGKIMEGTEYSKYAFENSFLRDNDDFIEKIPGPAKAIFNIMTKEHKFTVYTANDRVGWYISDKLDSTLSLTISLDLDSHKEGTTLKGETLSNIWITELQQRFFKGELKFTSMKAKNLVVAALKKI